jgi:hypothetical protein
MGFPRLSIHQYLASAALIAAGALGVWLPSRFELVVGNSDVRPAAVVLGIVLVSFGVVPIFARRWHVALVLLILPAALAGALAGAMIWDLRHLGKIVHAEGTLVPLASLELAQGYCGWGALLGAGAVPLIAAALAGWRARRERDPAVGGVGHRLERWHSVLILLALFAAVGGGLAGTVAWDLAYPGFYYNKFARIEGSESWVLARHRAYWGCWGALLGASAVPLASLMFAVYGWPEAERAEGAVGGRLRRARA